jgi:glycosyltransferase involved in cell wall biosynthesis
MRVLILGSVALPIPPPAQGGTEWIAYYQAKGLAEKGHEVILFGAQGTSENFKDVKNIKVVEIGKGDVSKGSKSQRKLDPRFTESSRLLRLETVYLSQICQKLIDMKDEYDIVLNNMRGEAVFLPLAKMLDKKFTNVMHLPIFDELADLFKKYNTNVITISNAQKEKFSDLLYLKTVYNGVETQKYRFNNEPEDYLLMTGTIGWHKNQGAAIKVAKKLGMKLVLAGKVRDEDYLSEIKKDIDGDKIKLLGELGFEEKVELLKDAKAFVFPILWEEPFGLVMIEAMSCGTPVVAFSNGAAPEVVRDGKTGFIVANEQEMAEAIKKIDLINRADCRRHVEENFSIDRMINSYEDALSMLR